MTTKDKIELLFQQITELPDEAQTELVQALVEMRAENLGIFILEEEERTALALSAEDIRAGRFASDQEVDEIFTSRGE